MYVRRVRVCSARALVEASLEFAPGSEAGWHVIIGPNGTGKSTMLRAIVFALIGERDAEASLVDLGRWVRAGEPQPRIDMVVAAGRPSDDAAPTGGPDVHSWSVGILDDAGGRGFHIQVTRGKRSPKPWDQARGWFSAAYGPFRRLSGGDKAYDTPRIRGTRLGAHMSALHDGFALSDAEAWLVSLHLEELEAVRELASALEDRDFTASAVLSVATASKDPEAVRERNAFDILDAKLRSLEADINGRMRVGRIKAVVGPSIDEDARDDQARVSYDIPLTVHTLNKRIIRFFNQSGFLFEGLAIVGINGRGVEVRDHGGRYMDLSQLSDGYRAILAIGLETLRLMLACYGTESVLRHMDEATGALDLPGVVLIDEVEAHLHPPWQEEVGTWLRRRFPRVQFIVTTHSPFVCRSVAVDGAIRGSVWEIRSPAEDEGPSMRRMGGQRLDRIVFGDLVEAVGTEAFGEHVAQSDVAEDMLYRLAELNRRAVRGQLEHGEAGELATLRATFPARSSET